MCFKRKTMFYKILNLFSLLYSAKIIFLKYLTYEINVLQ